MLSKTLIIALVGFSIPLAAMRRPLPKPPIQQPIINPPSPPIRQELQPPAPPERTFTFAQLTQQYKNLVDTKTLSLVELGRIIDAINKLDLREQFSKEVIEFRNNVEQQIVKRGQDIKNFAATHTAADINFGEMEDMLPVLSLYIEQQFEDTQSKIDELRVKLLGLPLSSKNASRATSSINHSLGYISKQLKNNLSQKKSVEIEALKYDLDKIKRNIKSCMISVVEKLAELIVNLDSATDAKIAAELQIQAESLATTAKSLLPASDPKELAQIEKEFQNQRAAIKDELKQTLVVIDQVIKALNNLPADKKKLVLPGRIEKLKKAYIDLSKKISSLNL